MDKNKEIYNKYVHQYENYTLYPAEREILRRFKASWHKMRMLDIGIGTGRTTYTFGAVAHEYIGIDYAEKMIEKCRSQVPVSADVSMLHMDARDLSTLYDRQFDFILFSLNGLDSVDHSSRERIILEIGKVVADTGQILISTHNIRNFGNSDSRPQVSIKSPLLSTYRLRRYASHRLRYWRLHFGADLDEIRHRNWIEIRSGDHDFKSLVYNVNPSYQIKEFERLGFNVDEIMDADANSVDPTTTMADWLYFLCSPNGQTLNA